MPDIKTTGFGGGGGYSTVQDEGIALPVRSTLNIVGQGIVADDSGGVTRIRVFDAATMSFVQDEFTGGAQGGTAFGTMGELGWGAALSAGANALRQDSEAGRPGLVRLSTGAVAANRNVFMLGDSTAGGVLVGTLLPADSFDVIFIVRPNNIDANTALRIGLAAGVQTNDPFTDGIYFEKLAADVNWFYVTRAAGVQTRTDSGIAVAAAFTKFRLRRSGANIGFTIDAAAEVLQGANIPTVALDPVVRIATAAAASKTCDVDYFSQLITGLAR